MNNPKLNAEKWTRRSETYDDKRFDYFRLMQKELISKIEAKNGYSYLDIGCGTGWAVFYLFESLQGNGVFKGVDISAGMIEKARAKIGMYQNIEFIQADACHLPFGNESFDRILCSNSFHHYPEPQGVINEIFRVLKQDGKAYILDVTRDGIIMNILNRVVQRREKEHVSFYSSKEYERYYEMANLRYRRIRVGHFRYPLLIHIGEKAKG